MTDGTRSSRTAWFDANRAAIEAYYLDENAGPFQQSGRSTGAERWEATRRPIADAVDCDGSFMDVGCANGLLLESVRIWIAERGLTMEPHGLDFVPGLIELARRRVPDGTFHIGNAWDWQPPQRYTFVRTSIEHVPAADRIEFVRRQHTWVEPGGRMILSWYPDTGSAEVDVPALVAQCGLELGEVMRPTDHTIVWVRA